MVNNNITCEEIASTVKKLKSNKAPFVDLIRAECIKENIDFLLGMLLNFVLNSEIYHDSWAEGLRFCNIRGAGDVQPIIIEPIFGQIFETIIDNCMTLTNDALGRSNIYNGVL